MLIYISENQLQNPPCSRCALSQMTCAIFRTEITDIKLIKTQFSTFVKHLLPDCRHLSPKTLSAGP